MKSWKMLWSVLGVAALTSLASAQPQSYQRCEPPLYRPPQNCLPGPIHPGQPAPSLPGFPGTPGATLGTPGTTPGTMPGTQPGAMPGTQPGATPGTQPGATPPADLGQPSIPQDAFAQATERGTEAGATFNPALFGDLIGFQGTRVVFVPDGATGNAGVTPVGGNIARVIAPVPYTAAYKVTENESPRPRNRVYFNYNYYNDVAQNVGGIGFGTPSGDLHRETIGFEKLIGDSGNTSIGLRLPFQQLVGDDGIEDSQVSNLSIIFKHAFYNDRFTGDVASGGMILTVPTGPAIEIPGQSDLNPTFFQPFLGFIKNRGNFFAQGFTAVVVPTDFRDVAVWFNSVSVGWWAYRADGFGGGFGGGGAPVQNYTSGSGYGTGLTGFNSCNTCNTCDECDRIVKGIIPVLELHVNTPLNHRGLNNTPIGFTDTVNLTAGTHVVLRRATFGLAIGIPLTGPKPYDFEVGANVNFSW